MLSEQRGIQIISDYANYVHYDYDYVNYVYDKKP